MCSTSDGRSSPSPREKTLIPKHILLTASMRQDAIGAWATLLANNFGTSDKLQFSSLVLMPRASVVWSVTSTAYCRGVRTLVPLVRSGALSTQLSVTPSTTDVPRCRKPRFRLPCVLSSVVLRALQGW